MRSLRAYRAAFRPGTRLAVLGVVAGLLLTAASPAEETRTWRDLKAAGDRTMAEVGYPVADRYWKAAEQFYLGALELAEREAAGPAVIAEILLSLSQPYGNLGRYQEAVEHLERAVGLAEQAHGPEDPALCPILDELGNLYFALERPDDSERAFERCLRSRERVYGPESLEVAASLVLLAAANQGRGKLEEGLVLYRRALAIREARLPPGHDLIDEAYAGVSVTLKALGREEEAERLRRRFRGTQ